MKLFLIHLLSGIGRLLLRLRGVRTGTGIILSGLPLIKKFPGASITIGNGVTIHSLTRYFPITPAWPPFPIRQASFWRMDAASAEPPWSASTASASDATR